MLSKRILVFVVIGLLLGSFCSLEAKEDMEGWKKAGYFTLGEINGRKTLIDPYGKPFYADGMVYAYGPEGIPGKEKSTLEEVMSELETIKKHGFNTIDLYGSDYLDEILAWCDVNEIALYPRTSYGGIRGLSPERREFPDFMDPNFRVQVKSYYDFYLRRIREHQCIMAVDMDQRWLFGVDWKADIRLGDPRLGPHAIKALPKWLKDKYKQIDNLNEVWGKKYPGFSDVLDDDQIISNGRVVSLKDHPWRVDLIEYTLWTITDFLKDLTGYMKKVDPNHLITITTELPEVIPFPVSTVENSGIDFLSPVHYNYLTDFNRDWIGAARLIFRTKFNSDLVGGSPVFINETGFRTSALNQSPPNMAYAMGKEGDEGFIAKMYLDQVALMNSLPWMSGWGFFKWFDKYMEGDFGYIRANGSLKPISELGKIVTPLLPVNWTAEKAPKVLLYYPKYFLASQRAGSNQYKSFISFLENDYLSNYKKIVSEMYGVIQKKGTGA
ncbi:MAG: beta-galactosidase, partial [Candidatus Theseobacter exili]|nr:beta-galactosidase [Candidatus Theseobacter exili]